MSTRCYDTDLNDAAGAWIAVPVRSRVGGGADDLRAVLNAIFYLLRTGCQWPARPRVPRRAPFTIIFGGWAELQGALHEQARLSRGRLPCPSMGHPGQSVGQDHRARRHPWFRWTQRGQRAQTPPAREHHGNGGPVGSKPPMCRPDAWGARLLAGFPRNWTVMATRAASWRAS